MQQQKQQKLMLNQKTNKNENQTKQRKLEDYGPYLFWYSYIFSCTLKIIKIIENQLILNVR